MAQTPVVLIPGLTGTRLVTQYQTNNSYDLWVSLSAMTSLLASDADSPCEQDLRSISGWDHPDPALLAQPNSLGISPGQWWLDQMSLAADGITPTQTPQYNRPLTGLDAISVLDTSTGMFYATWYFYYVIQALQNNGYDATNMIAAPYDWRTSPAGLESRYGYFTKLKGDIESLFTANGNTPVAMVAHSLGNRVTQYFLEWIAAKFGQSWIDTHIARYVGVSPLYIGAPKSLRMGLVGDYKIGPLSIDGMKPVLQSYGVVPWMFPVTRAQYPYLNSVSFAFLGSESHALTIDQALTQAKATSIAGFLQKYYAADPNFTSPGSETGNLAVQAPKVPAIDIFYATGQDTEIGAFYKPSPLGLELDTQATSSNPNFSVQSGLRMEVSGKTPQTIDGSKNSGDGTVPYGSLTFFKLWQKQNPSAKITGHQIAGSEHTKILGNSKFLTGLVSVL